MSAADEIRNLTEYLFLTVAALSFLVSWFNHVEYRKRAWNHSRLAPGMHELRKSRWRFFVIGAGLVVCVLLG